MLISSTISIKAQLADVFINFFGQNLHDIANFTYRQSIINDFASLNQVYHNDSKKSVIYIHSWLENFASEGPQKVLSSFFTRKDEFNVGFVDWSAYSMNIAALSVIPQLLDVAKSSKEMIQQMIEGGMDGSKLQLVGFGLGAIIAGDIGRELQKDGLKLTQITGLDVATIVGMTSMTLEGECQLRRTDADFVQIIHTNAGEMGESAACGHADFWPNGGFNQTGCGSVTIDIINDLGEWGGIFLKVGLAGF